MRQLTDHKVSGLNEAIKIDVLDEPGSGGANHVYRLGIFNDGHSIDKDTVIRFQNGPIKEVGYNGLSNEALLAILIDRMRGFQLGQFANRENLLALTNLEQALLWLQKRTRDRMARGVEGTHQK